MATSSPATDLFALLADEAADESPLWAAALRGPAEREHAAVFSPLVEERFALGLETIYEGYLVHYGRPRLFAPPDGDTALLLGDYLYAHGLVRIASTGDLEAVGTLAELISACAAIRAEKRDDDAEEWLRAVRRLAPSPPAPADEARAQAAHAARVG